ncbi:MAG: M23 family metallopeptidase [Clostridia bacterium]|nr:M23 family metallopeptidase [Clostridia bacterium]
MKKLFFTVLVIFTIGLCFSATASADVQIPDINNGWYWPVHPTVTTLTSPYGGWRNNFTNLHQGIDLSGGSNLSIYASRYGDVAFKGYDSDMGYYISLYHGEWNGYKIYSTYMHLAEQAYFNVGETVQGGQIIGKMGNTGSSDGTHLHFQITKSTGYVSSAYMPHKNDSQLSANFINTNPSKEQINEWGLSVWNTDRFNNSNHPNCKYGTIRYTKVGEPIIPPDTEAPTISGLNVKDISGDSFTVECNLNDNVGVTRVWFVLYAPGGTYEFGESASNGKLSYRFDTSKYGGAGTYSLGFYVYDAKENRAEGRTGGIYTVCPSQPENLKSNKTVYKPGEEIIFTWNPSEYARNYKVELWNGNIMLYSQNIGNMTSFTTPLSDIGNCTICVSAGNSVGYSNFITYSFVVTNDIPEMPAKITANKTICNTGEEIIFSWDAVDLATNYWVSIYNGNTKVYNSNIGNTTTFSSPFAYEGNYAFCVNSGNSNGYSESAICNFIITNSIPEQPKQLFSNKSVYQPNERVIFTWDAVDTANDYWVSIYNGKEKIFNSSIGNVTLFETSFSDCGFYAICINSGNSNGYSEATILRFTITDEPITVSKIIKSNNSFTINTTVYNFTLPYEIFVAGYNGNKLVSLSPSVNGVATLSGDIDTIKVMAWNSLSDLTSLCEAEVIPESEFIIQ